jgi:hypothetical protein
LRCARRHQQLWLTISRPSLPKDND